MAWYALYKWFIPWRETPYTNWVDWYRRHLYEGWFNSLPEDGQKAELGRQQRIKEKRKRDGETALARLGWLYSFMNGATHGRMYDYMETARLVNKISVHPSKYW